MKKMIKPIVAIALIFLVLSCANNQQYQQQQYQPTQAEVELQRVRVGIKNAVMLYENCKSANLSDSSVKLINSEVLFDANSGEKKVLLMSSTSKLMEKQKKAFLMYISLENECRNLAIREVSSIPSLSSIYSSYVSSEDVYFAKLLSKEITIGQANQQRAEVREKMKAQIASLMNNLNGQVIQSQQARQANAARVSAAQSGAITQYLLNQSSPKPYQSIPYQIPVAPQVNTNCVPNGIGGFNCTSR